MIIDSVLTYQRTVVAVVTAGIVASKASGSLPISFLKIFAGVNKVTLLEFKKKSVYPATQLQLDWLQNLTLQSLPQSLQASFMATAFLA